MGPSLSAWLAATGVAEAAEPPPENPYVFVTDGAIGMEPGVRTANAVSKVVLAADDVLAEAVRLDESRPAGKAVGIAGRVAKGALLDVPLVLVQVSAVHELLGHGARARELDLDPTYTFRLVPPYRGLFSGPEEEDEVVRIATTSYEESAVIDEDIAVELAGFEASAASVWWMQAGIAQRDGWMHVRDLLVYGAYRLDHVSTLAVNQGGPFDPATSNDVEAYLTTLQMRTNRWRSEDREAMGRNLQLGYLVGLADPLLWTTAYHAVVTHGVHGRRQARVAMPRVGGWSLLPALRYSLTPFGPEHGVDLFARRGEPLYNLYARAATGGVLRSYGVGGRAFGLPVGDGRRLGGEVDLWWQPDLMFERLQAYDRPQQLGAQLGLHVDWPIAERVGLVGKLAYKTEGYVLAQPLGAGPVGYLGLSVAPR